MRGFFIASTHVWGLALGHRGHRHTIFFSKFSCSYSFTHLCSIPFYRHHISLSINSLPFNPISLYIFPFPLIWINCSFSTQNTKQTTHPSFFLDLLIKLTINSFIPRNHPTVLNKKILFEYPPIGAFFIRCSKICLSHVNIYGKLNP